MCVVENVCLVFARLPFIHSAGDLRIRVRYLSRASTLLRERTATLRIQGVGVTLCCAVKHIRRLPYLVCRALDTVLRSRKRLWWPHLRPLGRNSTREYLACDDGLRLFKTGRSNSVDSSFEWSVCATNNLLMLQYYHILFLFCFPTTIHSG